MKENAIQRTERIARKISTTVKFSGVSFDGENFKFDFLKDSENDIIKLAAYKLNTSNHSNNVYWFGYRFEPSSSSKQRTDFINYIKGTGSGRKISDSDLRKFIELPLNALSRLVSLYSINCTVYPISGRSQLVSKMIKVIYDNTPHNANRCSFELVKKSPIEIEFDWDGFEMNFADNPNYGQMVEHVKEDILPKIKRLDYFSLAHNVKPKYRPFIKNYLGFPDIEKLEEFSKLKGENILIVDDINTSGSTLNEILRILNEVNDQCNIFIYTLIGKENGF